MKKKTIIIIIVAVVAVFFFIAVAVVGVGFFVARKVQRETGITDMHLNKQGSGTIEFKGGKMELGKAATWPADMPSEVPKITYGKVVAVTKSEINNKKGWNIVLEGFDSNAAEKYKAELKNNGWNVMQTTNSTEGGSIMADTKTLQFFMMYTNEKQTASFSVNEKD
jgi:hypothetical protein